jgi:4-hydroxy-tetrahydrodipicolinate reductase
MVSGAMIRVCVAGITGWTGSAVAAAIDAADDIEVEAGVAPSRAGEPRMYASVDDALSGGSVDVLVDYTSAAVVRSNVLAALRHGVAVVVGSSGLTADDYDEIDARARAAGAGVIAAGNFSILAALLLRSARDIARHVDTWEIVDYASAGKPDVPSGTARELAEQLGAVRRPAAPETLQGPREARGADVAGARVHSVRLPSFSVSTEIVFGAAGERLSIRHDAGESPEPYVAGTLLAIRAVVGRVGLTRGLDALLP